MTPILEMRAIQKSFLGVQALKKVSFTVRKGSVHGLVGENGAGKSTLMKILSGAYQADDGEVHIDGQVVNQPTPEKMLGLGVAVIYQELAQAPHLSVAENMYLGRLPKTSPGFVNWSKTREQAGMQLRQLGFNVDPKARVDTLSIAQRQMVEIAKAISRNARVVVLDEPSAVLGDAELSQLFTLIRKLSSERSITFIYISHRLKELHEICEDVTILRDGAVIATRSVAKTSSAEVIRLMVGRDLTDIFPPRAGEPGEICLLVKELSRKGVLQNLSFDLRRGEILGICGLAGSGRTELLRAICGADQITSGELIIAGKVTTVISPRAALGKGIGLLPEDRKTEGLFLNQTVGFNITIAALRAISRGWIVRARRELDLVTNFINTLHIKTPSAATKIMNLSGGNQQKCGLARQLAAGTQILLVDEPTRGVDVAAKREIYDLLIDLTRRERKSIIMVSSELPEVLGLCDRIIVMRDGAISSVVDGRSATEESLMSHAVLH
jgi:ribose transport system ATP-binding protein